MTKFAKQARFPEGAVFVHRAAEGVELRFLNDPSSADLYWTGEYEPGSIEVFSALCRKARFIFDVGAYGGLYAVFAAAANPNAVVFAFEANPAAVRVCRQNLTLNAPRTKNVQLFELALSDYDGEAEFYVTGGTSSLNSAFRPNSEPIAVEVARGDAVVRARGVARLDLVKVDTESTEPAVLRGLAGTLERDHPDVLCEVLRGRTERDLEALLGPLGYSYYWITSRALHRRDRIAGDPTYRFPNYLFTVRSVAELTALGLPVIEGNGRSRL